MIPLKVLGLQTIPGLMPVTLMAHGSQAFGVYGLPQIGSQKYVKVIS